MNIIVKVPDNIYKYCKNKLKLTDKKISVLYTKYVNSVLDETFHEPMYLFEQWVLSDDGQDIIQS